MQKIIIAGNPVDGLTFHGPFAYNEVAEVYGEDGGGFDEWWMTDLHKPEWPEDMPEYATRQGLVDFHKNQVALLEKIRPFISGDDIELTLEELVARIAERIKDDPEIPMEASNAFRGYHQFQTDIGTKYGSFEVFYNEADPIAADTSLAESDGWFWWACQPGCIPDGDPNGPFPTSEGAYLDAIGD